MHLVWGSLMALVGLAIFAGATTRTRFVVYRLLEARAQVLFKQRARTWLQSVGAVLAVLGVMWAAGVIWE